MSFMEAVKKCLSGYVDFQGRAPRSEYWWFYLFYFVTYVVAIAIDAVATAGILSVVVTLALFLPLLAVSIRRLHDGGRSGWWILISLIPFVGVLVLLYFMIMKGTEGPNDWGPDPVPDSGPKFSPPPAA